MKFAFFDAKPYDRVGFDRYACEYDIEFKYYDSRLCEDTVTLAAGCDGVVVFVNDVLNRAVIDALYIMGIRLICLRCAGFNNVDVRAASGKITILRVPAYSPYAVAEHAMAMLLTSVRRTHKAYIRSKDFNFSLDGLVGFDLYSKTVGIIGTGKIGSIFINICRGFGMNVLAYDKNPNYSADFEYVPLKRLFTQSDIISLHCPLTEKTHHIIDEDSISLMKKGVIIINTSRGALIDADALLDGIKAKHIGAACLDVYEEESDIFFKDNSGHIVQDDTLARLISMPNVLITSHQAFLTNEALSNIAKTTVDNILAFSKGIQTENEVMFKENIHV